VVGVLPALATELREFQTLGRGLLVLGRRVVPVFALTALQCDDLSHLQPRSLFELRAHEDVRAYIT
jgi:hypothetical protein